ncbi:acyl carrier protein, partial [Rhizobium ruizarguesonis]
ITADSELTSLGIDSLALADVLWDLEQAYGIRIEMNTADAWSNLKNIGGRTWHSLRCSEDARPGHPI